MFTPFWRAECALARGRAIRLPRPPQAFSRRRLRSVPTIERSTTWQAPMVPDHPDWAAGLPRDMDRPGARPAGTKPSSRHSLMAGIAGYPGAAHRPGIRSPLCPRPFSPHLRFGEISPLPGLARGPNAAAPARDGQLAAGRGEICSRRAWPSGFDYHLCCMDCPRSRPAKLQERF